jgi:hypothetical protein
MSMGLASDNYRLLAAATPLYCTPFFRRCKYFFQKTVNFFNNFFKGMANKPQQTPNAAPKPVKHMLQHPACGQFPADTARCQPQSDAQADISLADGKAEPEPLPEGEAGEHQIGNCDPATPDGP